MVYIVILEAELTFLNNPCTMRQVVRMNTNWELGWKQLIFILLAAHAQNDFSLSLPPTSQIIE